MIEMTVYHWMGLILIPVLSWVIGFSMCNFLWNRLKPKKFSYRAFLRAFPDGLVIIRDSETGIISEISTRTAKFLGYDFSSDIVGKRCDYIFGKSIPCSEGKCSVDLISRDGEKHTFDAQLISANYNSMLVRVTEENLKNE